jgi:hypothetical protein
MSRALNPNVIAYVPRKVEAAAKAIRAETLTYPLPAKPLSAQSPRHIRQRRAREIVTPRVQLQRLENVRVIHPPAAPSVAFLSKRYVSKPQNRKRQRRGKQPLFDWFSTPQEVSCSKQPLPDFASTPAENGSIIDWDREASLEWRNLSDDIQQLHEGAKKVGCYCSPYLPKTAEEYEWRRKQMKQERERKRLNAQKIREEEKGCPKVKDRGEKCMGGKTFDTNHSAVLANKTIWCPKTWPDEQEEAIWPIKIEFITEGWDRHRNGYGRYYPVPRSEEFEWRLATPAWLADPKGTKYPVWDGKKTIPAQEKRFARVRGELDCIVGSGRWVDEEFLFDRAEETAWEDGTGVIGKTLWEMIEEDEREDIEEVEEDAEDDEEEEEVGEDIEEEERRLFENYAMIQQEREDLLQRQSRRF